MRQSTPLGQLLIRFGASFCWEAKAAPSLLPSPNNLPWAFAGKGKQNQTPGSAWSNVLGGNDEESPRIPIVLERLFDPFERSSQTVVENIQGTGLGMSISKSLAEAMGGAISVESEVGKGSTFTLVLDLKIGDDAEAAAGSGMNAHASKPIVLEELEQTLHLCQRSISQN